MSRLPEDFQTHGHGQRDVDLGLAGRLEVLELVQDLVEGSLHRGVS